jgi:hypothetical protein
MLGREGKLKADRALHGVKPREEQQESMIEDLLVVQLLPVDLGVDQDAEDVIPPLPPALGEISASLPRLGGRLRPARAGRVLWKTTAVRDPRTAPGSSKTSKSAWIPAPFSNPRTRSRRATPRPGVARRSSGVPPYALVAAPGGAPPACVRTAAVPPLVCSCAFAPAEAAQ